MADHPLRSATHRRLGRPLPYQLANGTRAHLCPINLLPLFDAETWSYAVLAPISKCYPPDRGRLLTRYSPVRHWRIATPVRLACVKHAASVRPEPESNSQVYGYILQLPLPYILSKTQFNPDLVHYWLILRKLTLCSNSFFFFYFPILLSMCRAVPFRGTACIYYHIPQFMSTIFWYFFKNFFKVFPEITSTTKSINVAAKFTVKAFKMSCFQRLKKPNKLYKKYCV